MPPTDAHAQPVGDPLPTWTRRPTPPRIPMAGRFCRLEPLEVERHADALFAAYAEAEDARDWTYLPHEPAPDRAAFRAFVDERARSVDPLHMAVCRDGEPLGAAALMRADPANGTLEIGHVHFAPRLQRTTAATEALTLMMRRAFDDLGYRRLEWKCDSLNAPSRRAAIRLGFRFEGVFRNHLVTKGRNRDTAWFAVTDSDWPALRVAIDRWTAPDNFDANGRQKSSLSALRDGGA